MMMNEQEDTGHHFESSPVGEVGPSPREWGPGMVLNGRYMVESELGRGGIGVVYLARDRKVASRLVIVKVLHQKIENSSNNLYLKRKFRQELEALARIKHHGIVGVHDADVTPEGRQFLVLEFVQGVTLRTELDELRRRRIEGMEFDRVAHITRSLGQALTAAHKEKVFHRDLKPENIMLHYTSDDGEEIKIIDFGIATVKDSQVAANRTETEVAGTIPYMAPEQLMGRPEAASDLYALGVIAYEMLTGRVPFNAKSAVQQYEWQQTGNLARPRMLRPDLPERAETVILTALSFRPEDRQARARDFGEQLTQALTAAPEPAPEPTLIETRTLKLADEVKDVAQLITRKITELQEPPTDNRSQPVNVPDPKLTQAVEIAHVLFMDIVGYSKLLTDDQVRIVQQLTAIVESVPEFRDAQARDDLISLDTGDGMALVFFHDPEAPIRCAQETAVALKRHPQIQLRMGIHSGPIYRRRGIGAGRNVAGSGINIAQRVMDCGDAGHILLSKGIAELLSQLSQWINHLHDLGECEVKHGLHVHVFNFYTGEVGNSDLPLRLQAPPKSNNGKDARQASPTRTDETYEPGSPTPKPAHVAPEDADEQTRELPADRILTQIFGVSHQQDLRGNEGLIYALAPLGVGEAAPERAFVPIKGQVLQQHIENVRRRIEELIWRALLKQTHEGSGFEAAATDLARHALPECGFVGMMGANIHPQFDIIPDIASQIPWEILEEIYYTCLRCNTMLPPYRVPEATQLHCSSCGEKMTWGGAKLALAYHLSHLVRGPSWPTAEGRQFLIIKDPTDDLCSSDNEAGRTCAQHLLEIQASLERQGYQINLLAERNATGSRVLTAIRDPSVVGIYYFGHGYFPRDGDEGILLLSDGPLYASQVEEARPKARFVFLNSCEGAVVSRDWGIEQRARSVAEAFARGGRGRAVIAPLWPMVSVQAAETALEFFRQASPATPAGIALRHARSKSLYRYESGDAHIAWMSYRYYGDPNKPLPVPVEVARASGATRKAPAASRVFGTNRQLDVEVFGFAMDDVMLRAAKRRNLQGRTLVTLTDFVAGLVRRGNLMRFVLGRANLKADSLYEEICEQAEVEPGMSEPVVPVPLPTFVDGRADDDAAEGEQPREQMSEEERRSLLARWIVRDKEQFSPRLAAVLERAEALVQRTDEEGAVWQISEQQVLESLISAPEWEQLVALGLPPVEVMRRALRERAEEGRIDENGTIRLAGLDEGAQRIIETAHVLAQQRGIYPITNRLLFAAFLTEKTGFAARVCARAGVRRELLFTLMIAASKKRPPRSFGLDIEACERIVLPVIAEAKRIGGAIDLITERELFRAFCEKAGEGLKEILRLPALGADLDQLKLIDPDAPVEEPPKEPAEPATSCAQDLLPLLHQDAKKILARACQLAGKLKVAPIQNRVLLASFLGDLHGFAARSFQRHGVPPNFLREQLMRSASGGAQAPVTLTGADADIDPDLLTGIATDVLVRASELAGEKNVITEPLLFKAFCEVSPLKRSLKHSLRVDLEKLAAEIDLSVHEGGDVVQSAPPVTDMPLTGPLILTSADGEKGTGTYRFDEQAERALEEAARLAWQQGWLEIRSPHLFAGLIRGGTGVAAEALRATRLNPEAVKQALLSLVRPRKLPAGATPNLRLSSKARQIIARAARTAAAEGRERTSEQDILRAFLADGGVVSDALRQLGTFNVPQSCGDLSAPLTIDKMEVIANLALAEMVNRTASSHGVFVQVDAEVARWIAEKAAGESSDAGVVQRTVDACVTSPVISILKETRQYGGQLKVVLIDGAIKVERLFTRKET